MDHEFRSAAFGGFQKQDVLDFLESSAKEHAEQLSASRKKLKESETERTRLDEECTQAKARIEELESQLEGLRAERNELSAALEASRAENEDHAQELGRLRAEAEQLRRELEEQREETARLAPDAAAYVAVKDRTAGVELRAHRRAQEIQDQARTEAKQLRQDTQRWLENIKREYAKLCSQTKDSTAHVIAELEQARDTLDQVERLMDERSAALTQLDEAYDRLEPESVPAPMPLTEE